MMTLPEQDLLLLDRFFISGQIERMQKLESTTPAKNKFWPARKLSEARQAYRLGGFRGVLKHLGWKVVAGLFIYYLIRDVSLYIILPWYIARKITE